MPSTTTKSARASTNIEDCDNLEIQRLFDTIATALGKNEILLRRQWAELRRTFSAQLTRNPQVGRHRKPFAAYAAEALPKHQLVRVLDIVYAEHWNQNLAAFKKEASYRTRAARDLDLEHHLYLYLWFGENAVASLECWKSD